MSRCPDCGCSLPPGSQPCLTTDHCPSCPFAACDGCRYQPPARAAHDTAPNPATDEEQADA